VNAYDRTNSNKDSFTAVIRKFDPSNENYALKDFDFKLALYVDKDPAKATGLLISYLKDNQKPVSVEAIGNWFINYASRFEEENFKTMGTELDLFKLRAIDKDKEYWLYLMQMLCAAQAENEVKAKEAAIKAYKHPFIPAEYKSYLKETYSLTD